MWHGGQTFGLPAGKLTFGDGIAMSFFDGLYVTIPCPSCDYEIDVELLSVRLEESVFCPCCKVSIQLVDADASAHRAQKRMEWALKSFESHLN